jgi:hypothetical protein
MEPQDPEVIRFHKLVSGIEKPAKTASLRVLDVEDPTFAPRPPTTSWISPFIGREYPMKGEIV